MSELDPSQLWLEVTETYVLNDHERVVATLDALRNLGATIAVDDFGTGYSSLTYLRRFPVGIVKIDRQFVNGIGRATHDEEIVAAVVRLGHALGLRVVAEGIETLEQLQYLQALGCDAGQGFYLARPAPAHVVAFEAPAPDATTAAR
jgi:EAL domain-containing protein (putative c-di-GMP-specific phosphodiesterase class I)